MDLFHSVIENSIYIAQGDSAISAFGKAFHCIGLTSFNYFAFCDDFGPMNMACIVRFVEMLESEKETHRSQKIVLRVSPGPRLLTNAVFLLGSYLILKRNMPLIDVCKAFCWINATLVEPYRDATFSN